MKTISYWAKANVNKARLLIALLYTVLLIAGLLTAITLSTLELYFSNLAIAIPFGIHILALLFYPFKNANKGIFKHSFLRQKIHDSLIPFSFILIAILTINNFVNQGLIEENNQAFVQPVVLKGQNDQSPKVKKGLFSFLKKKSKSNKKKIRKKLLKLKQKIKNGDGITIALFSLLLVLGIVGSIFFLTYLICGISCSASTSSLIPFIIGSGLSVFLVVFSIRRMIAIRTKVKTATSS